MKCEVCLELLEEYLDGELDERESGEVAAHLITCPSCSAESAKLVAEQEMFARYDRELEMPASLWGKIAERTVAPVIVPVAGNGFASRFTSLFKVPAFGFSLATAVLIAVALVIGGLLMKSNKSDPTRLNASGGPPTRNDVPKPIEQPRPSEQPEGKKVVESVGINHKPKLRRTSEIKQAAIDQSDVLSSDLGYADIDDQDTAKHIEQTQNLLRSIRNVQLNDNDTEIDVSYDKALSRRLLNENIVLRRDAEMKAKFPTKALLSDLEPFLIDIANLPDQAKPEDVRVIKERVQKTEIVAALIGYE